MDTNKQIVSMLFFLFSIVSILCFSNKFDPSSIIFHLSDINQLINRRNMILLCHFILLFIVKDSGLLTPRRNESNVYKEKIVAPPEKEHRIEAQGVRLEKVEQSIENYIKRSLDMVVLEKRESVTESYVEEQIEVTEKSEVEELEYLSEEKIEVNGVEEGKEAWELLMERRGGKEELEKESIGGGIVCTGEEEVEKESVEEFNRKIEEFIEKFKKQRLLESMEIRKQPVLV